MNARTRLLMACGIAGVSFQAAGQDGDQPLRFGDPDSVRYHQEFFPATRYDSTISTPEGILGQQLGSRMARQDEIVRCFERWASESPRLTLAIYASSHEGRKLIRAVITSASNMQRLDKIQAALGRLADPRGLSAEEERQLVEETPAAAWLGYSIHGDETSGCDAALAVAYHLVAGEGPELERFRDSLVMVVDPVMNPDGRARIIGMVEQSTGRMPSLDRDTMQRGRWPHGRGNHYLFDLNRDWMAGSQPETRGRWRAIRAFHPQLLVDAHEMGSSDTYLFYPQAEPRNPHLPLELDRWQKKFGDDQGAVFDRQGWSYYTREWADAWAPFYTDAWGSLNGAVGILYEQASTSGYALKRPSGKILTYREAVHHHVLSSMANLTTLRDNRRAILQDYVKARRHNVAADAPGNDRMLVVIPGRNADRETALLRILAGQGIEVDRSTAHFEAEDVSDTLGGHRDRLDVPPGAYLVSTRQPASPLVKTYLSFEERPLHATLLEERKELEQKGQSKMYDDTAWSLALSFDLEAYWCLHQDVSAERLIDLPEAAARVVQETEAPVAWVVDGARDASVSFAARAMALGVVVHLADKEFETASRVFPRGSLLVRRHENEEGVDALVARAAAEAGVEAFATSSGRAPGAGPDLGGGHFELLHPPRVALLSNAPVRVDHFGHLWHWLDQELGVSVSMLDAQSFGSSDLRQYNVLILPPAGGLSRVLGPYADSITNWVRAGGTLIACSSSAAQIAGGEFLEGLSSVRLRRNALDKLDDYRFAAERERRAQEISVDEAELWGDPVVQESPAAETAGAAETVGALVSAGTAETAGALVSATQNDKQDETKDKEGDAAEREDRWRRRFSPSGVFVRAEVDPRAWITAGTPKRFPAHFGGSNVFLSQSPVSTPVRLARADELRISGLLWPEARERIADSAYVTVEGVGKGQLILFATLPAYRGSMRSSGRLLSNAVTYGPGLGTSPVDVR